ncbi:uncharacterized protein [Leptinotarsa decemlineata]|uniref:uncharacterized protein n=1 Tax=Leptinotarsa decemlineata TaxID=7539 RepID=UPI003D30ADC8
MKMLKNNKKVRSSNFSREEEMNLIQEIEKFKHILECKITNKVTNAEKEEAWRKVLSSFNSRNLQVRSISQIKSKFDNLKTKAKKEMAKQKSYMRGTGGGPAIKIELDHVTEATLNVINMKTVVGLNNSLDSDFINVKVEYYKKKKELLEKRVEAEEKERSRRREREEEEHLKKMILLDLEIKLKEKQLK